MLIIALSPGVLKLGIVMLLLGSLMMGVVTKLRKLFTKNKKAFFLYIIVTVLLFALVGLLANNNVLNNSPLGNFISFQILFLLLGSIHVWALRRFFDDLSEEKTDFWPEFFYTIVTTVFGLIGFALVIQLFKLEYTYIFLAATICFIIPFLMVKLYEYATVIPVPIYKKWNFPIGESIKDPKENELKNPRVISFEFNKDIDSDEISNFRLKAPEQMEFGKLFYFFINDYNERHPEGEISYLDNNNASYQWVFYSKPNWLGQRKHYDFAKTVEANNIKEDDIVICQRA